jgi:cell division protein FtsQ
LRAVAQDKVRSGSHGAGEAQSGEDGAGQSSWFSVAEANADRASRAGFLISMLFLAATATYAVHLTGAMKSVFDGVAALADEAAYDAGFRLERLKVSGAKNTPDASLRQALNVPYTDSSLSYDTAEAQKRLLKIGWVVTAEVRRILPSELEVAVTEREPFARWADSDNALQAIDREGRILGPAEGRFETLPLFAGDGAPAEAAAFLDALSDREAVRRRMARAELVAERFWLIRLDNGVAVKLPRKVNDVVLARLESLLASSKITEMALQTIDLRLGNRTILQLKEPTLANRDRAISALTSAPPQPFSAPRKGRSS